MPGLRNPRVPPQAGSREDRLVKYAALLGYYLHRRVRIGTQCTYEIYEAHKPFTRLPPHVKGAQPLYELGSMAVQASFLLDEDVSQGVLSAEAVEELQRLANG